MKKIACGITFLLLGISCASNAQQLDPRYAVVQGEHRVTSDWMLTLPGKFNRRVDGGKMYLWQPGFSVVLAVWNNTGEATDHHSMKIRAIRSDAAFDAEDGQRGSLYFFTFREPKETKNILGPGFHCHVYAAQSHLELVINVDGDQDNSKSKALCYSARATVSQ